MTLFITDPSPEYETWRNQPCVVFRDVGEGFVDVRLTGKKDTGLILRVRVSAVSQ
jgi:hypothetical protein